MNSFLWIFFLISRPWLGTNEIAFASTRRFLKASPQNLTRVDLQDLFLCQLNLGYDYTNLTYTKLTVWNVNKYTQIQGSKEHKTYN